MKNIIFAFEDIKILEFIEANIEKFEIFKDEIAFSIVTDISYLSDEDFSFVLYDFLYAKYFTYSTLLYEKTIKNYKNTFNDFENYMFIFEDYDMFDYDFEKNIKNFINNIEIEKREYIYVQ